MESHSGNSDSGQFCHSPQHLPFSVHVSNSGATSAGGRCSVSGQAGGGINVHVSAIPLDQQSHPETMCHSEGRRDPNSPLVVITVVSTCGPLSVQKVVPSARMEALSCSIIKQQDFEKRSLQA